ncbi:HK97 family phage prohead protease [Pelagibacterium montanilacus]|uniref:HK97 family phage prohead protease n=1 Tax=Pelagibacterium montanilacus TaxID=2185280 RepID=UPI000F8CBEDF|nr:HK97 family phage prohead protease [Pelagibacterium montanilacus]
MSVVIDADGRFSGYASIFGRRDQGGDIVMPGAFAASLALRGPARIRLLFQHDPKEPVGVWEEAVEDATGLKVAGRLLEGVPRAASLRHLIAQGGLDGLSIGFRAVRATREQRSGTRRLWALDLWEISIVTFPMMDAARIGAAPGGDAARLAATLGAAARLMRTKKDGQ